jgi:3-isopropylmalate dehydrogenase
MSSFNIAVIKGDGIGPEIVTEAEKVLNAVGKKYGHEFNYTDILMGGCSIDKYGVPLTDEALAIANASDAVLLGAVGGKVGESKWYELPANLRPEAGLLAIRKGMGLFCNLRPAKLFPQLRQACPLKESIIGDKGFDFVVVRELTGGVYFGPRKTEVVDGIRKATDTMPYDENEIKRIVKSAFEIAMKRGKKLASVDKANVLDTSRLWRQIVSEVAADYPEVTVENVLVDNCAMQLVKNPLQFDVIVTENMFGDILTDEASEVTGSIGMLSSASLGSTYHGDKQLGLYEPSHGSAPDIAGKNLANPLATILSAAMMLKYSFNLEKEAKAIEDAVNKVLDDGYRTGDIILASEDASKFKKVGTKEMGDAVAANI